MFFFRLWIIVGCFLVMANSGLLGNFLILRKQAMLGDAISHALLPGIVLGFIISNTHSNLFFLIGAFASIFLAFLIIGFLENKIGLDGNLALGLTFTSFFAFGVILISVYTQKVDLDPKCILFGNPIFIPFEKFIWNGLDLGPKAIWTLCSILLLNIVLVALFYPYIRISSFDPFYATQSGVKTSIWYYLLLFLTTLTTLFSFKIVGSTLVIAFLVIPSATAYLMSDSLLKMHFYTQLINLVVSVVGFFLAEWLNVSIPGAMVTLSGILFALTFVSRCLIQPI